MSNGDKFMKTFRRLPEEKRERLLKIIFNRTEFKKFTQTNTSSSKASDKANTDVYRCPRCGNEDHSLAYWRKFQSRDEKWDQHINEWYQKKKCERNLANEKSMAGKIPRAELFATLKSFKEKSIENEAILNKCKMFETNLEKNSNKKDIEKSPRPEPEKSQLSKSKPIFTGTENFSPVVQKAILQVEAYRSYSEEIQEKIDSAKCLDVPNEETEKSFLTSTRFSDADDLDESELRDAPIRDDSLLEGISMTHISMTPSDYSMAKEGDDTVSSGRSCNRDVSQKSPGQETILVGKSGFTRLITSPGQYDKPEMVSIIDEPEPEAQSNSLLTATPEWTRTYHLSTIPEESGESRNSSRGILREIEPSDQETETAASEQRKPGTSALNQSQESLPVFSPPQMAPQQEPEHYFGKKQNLISENTGSFLNPGSSTLNQSQESLPVNLSPQMALQEEPKHYLGKKQKLISDYFSPKMTRYTTNFRLPSSYEPDEVEENATTPEASEANPDTVENPIQDSAQDPTQIQDQDQDPPRDLNRDEPHMIIPNVSSSGAVQVCQLVDGEKKYMSRLSGIFKINRRCYHI